MSGTLLLIQRVAYWGHPLQVGAERQVGCLTQLRLRQYGAFCCSEELMWHGTAQPFIVMGSRLTLPIRQLCRWEVAGTAAKVAQQVGIASGNKDGRVH